MLVMALTLLLLAQYIIASDKLAQRSYREVHVQWRSYREVHEVTQSTPSLLIGLTLYLSARLSQYEISAALALLCASGGVQLIELSVAERHYLSQNYSQAWKSVLKITIQKQSVGSASVMN